jgi:Uncharacterised protein conserved in bacteria (DUF2336)
VKAPNGPNLEGLDRLARRNGVDIRPTLVRVLTDLYLQKPLHSSEEERHYTELILRLLDVVDVPTRHAVANKLAAYPGAPLPVVRKLASDVLEVARPILLHSPKLSGSELLAVVTQGGPSYAAVVAQRLEARQHGESGARAADERYAPATEHPSFRASAVLATREPALTPAFAADLRLGEAFLDAGRPERRAMLSNLEGGETSLPRWAVVASGMIGRLEAAALQRKPDEFTRTLERALGLTPDHARRIVDDPGGEPLLVAAKAIAMPSDVLLRILLFLNPAIGHSVTRVFDLAKAYEALSRFVAVKVIASLRTVGVARKWADYRPLLSTDQPDRGLAGEAARRAIPAFRGASAEVLRTPRDRASANRSGPQPR